VEGAADQERSDHPFSEPEVLFATGSSELKPEFQAILQGLLSALRAHPDDVQVPRLHQ